MKITGERPVDGVTPDGLVACHTAGYLEIASRLPTGRVLDIGCGVGFGTAHLAGEGRDVVGVDYALDAAQLAHGRGLHVACMDGARLGFRERSFAAVCSSQIIEHFHDPERHVAEIARVLAEDGTAFILTPNASADLENPFHVYLFDRAGLQELLSRYFDDVWVGAHEAAPRVKADFAARRRTARRVLNVDFLDLRHKVPRSWYIASYAFATRVLYRLQARRHAGGVTRITAEDFYVTDDVDDDTLSLFAIAGKPRR